MASQRQVSKSDCGTGPVKVGEATFPARWKFDYSQLLQEANGQCLEGPRADCVWTVTVDLDKLGPHFPTLAHGQQTTVQLGNWPQTLAHLHSSWADETGGTVTFRFSSEPPPL